MSVQNEPTEIRDALVGRRVGEYVVQRQVGGGGMGMVYEALQPMIGRRVAIKFLRPQMAGSTEHVQRLLAEARAANAIRHRGIIDIFGYGELEGVGHYIVMEFLEGQSLEALLAQKRRLPEAEVLWILDEVLDALEIAHAAGIVHRDLKPSNIFIVPSGKNTKFIKLLDFGLAKRTQAAPGTSHTVAGSVVGTPEYLSPEQATASTVGPASDLYSLGIVAFELLTGDIPYQGETPNETILAHVQKPVPHVRSLRSSVDPALDKVVFKMMAKLPKDRPTLGEVRGDLKNIRKRLMDAATTIAPAVTGLGATDRTIRHRALDDPQPTTTHTQPDRFKGPRSRWVLWSALGALLVGGAFVAYRWTRPRAPLPLLTPLAPARPVVPLAPEPTTDSIAPGDRPGDNAMEVEEGDGDAQKPPPPAGKADRVRPGRSPKVH